MGIEKIPSTKEKPIRIAVPFSENSRGLIRSPTGSELAYITNFHGDIGNIFSEENLVGSDDDGQTLTCHFRTNYYQRSDVPNVLPVNSFIDSEFPERCGPYRELGERVLEETKAKNGSQIDFFENLAIKLRNEGKFSPKKVNPISNDPFYLDECAQKVVKGKKYIGDCQSSSNLFIRICDSLGVKARKSIYNVRGSKFQYHIGAEARIKSILGEDLWVRTNPTPERDGTPLIIDNPFHFAGNYLEIWHLPCVYKNGMPETTPIYIEIRKCDRK
jgi:hypothetical protein